MTAAERLDLAIRLAQMAGDAILPHFRTGVAVENKGGAYFDPVTAADRAAEEVIRRELARVCPDDAIFGEEQGRSAGTSGLTWVIDPIDGTRAFIIGHVHWGTLIALHDGQRPVVGVMHQPFVGETFIGSDDGAFWMRGGEKRAMRTRACERLADAAVCTTFIATPEERAVFDGIGAKAKLVRFGGDCYNYCLLAAGFIDVVIETGLKAYDIQAVVPMIEAAGGVITNWSGGSPYDGGQIVAVGDRRLHAQLLEMF